MKPKQTVHICAWSSTAWEARSINIESQGHRSGRGPGPDGPWHREDRPLRLKKSKPSKTTFSSVCASQTTRTSTRWRLCSDVWSLYPRRCWPCGALWRHQPTQDIPRAIASYPTLAKRVCRWPRRSGEEALRCLPRWSPTGVSWPCASFGFTRQMVLLRPVFFSISIQQSVAHNKFTAQIHSKSTKRKWDDRTWHKKFRSFPGEWTIWAELRSRLIRAPAVHTSSLLSTNFTPKPKPRSHSNKGERRCTHTDRAHTRSAQETLDNSQPETLKGSWSLLLLLLLCCCCFTIRDASRSATRHNRLILVFCFFQRTQERVTAQ